MSTPPTDVRAEYKRRRSLQIIVVVVGGLVGLVVCGATVVLVDASSAKFAFAACVVPLVLFTFWNWRCPACKG